MTVRRLLAERLKETKQSSEELARAIEVPGRYVHDLLVGSRRPPAPARTDVYDRMTRFLKLGRTDLVDCATAELADVPVDSAPPATAVQDRLLDLCVGRTASRLRRQMRLENASMVDLFARVLAVVQVKACRSLADQIPLRIAATRNGASYPEVRMRVLEFLDRTPATLTVDDLLEFVLPVIAEWDVDENGVLKVVLRAAASTERHQRRPLVRSGRARMAG
jgi:hypothetical protein